MPFEPASGGIRRLLKPQYLGSLRVLFGDAAVAAANAPQDQSIKGFDAIGAAELTVGSAVVDQYEGSARAVAAAVVAQAPDRLPCVPSAPTDAACFQQIAREVGRVAWRRPLTEAEVGRLTSAAQTSADAHGAGEAGAEAVLSALLQSPNFLYLVEIGEPDAQDPTKRRLTPLELVTRMSFFLLNATPDKALLDAAESGALSDDEGVREVARQLLARPEARGALDAFYTESFRLRELEIMQKDANLFPQLTDTLKEAMREETLRLVRDIVWDQDSDALALFDANYTFVNAELASLYGVAPPPGGDFAEVVLPEAQQRMGVLGHAGLLALLSHTNSTSPTRRGLFITTNLLCSSVPPPPPDVISVLPADDGTPKTMKQRLETHMKEERCASCHVLTDPIGFALEHFDGIGAFRETDKGLTIDPSGSVPVLGDFADVKELAALIKNDPRSAQCLVRNLFRHAMGHLETEGELGELALLDAAFAESGHRIQEYVVELCTSRAFRMVGDPK